MVFSLTFGSIPRITRIYTLKIVYEFYIVIISTTKQVTPSLFVYWNKKFA